MRAVGPRRGGRGAAGAVLIIGAHVAGRGVVDVRVAAGRVAECGPGLRARPGEDELPARGGWLLPGLHDHHVHLRALAAAAASVHLGPGGALADRLREADRALPPGAWLRGVGYHESVAGPLDRWTLDRLLPHRPVRVQHRSGALWVLNSRAAELVGLDACRLPGVERDGTGRATGRLWRLDSWLAGRTGSAAPGLAAVSAEAAVRGVTGFTDATPALSDQDITGLAGAVARGEIAQRLHCMAPPGAAGVDAPRFTLGPVKALLDDATLPGLDELAAGIAAAHGDGRPVAVHCVTRVQFALTLAALDSAGVRAGDRIEHGAVLPAESLAWLRDRRVTVVTQPQFVVERGEQYERDVPEEDRPDLWRLRSLVDAGVRVAAGTDGPFGGADPWRALRAATDRPGWLPTDETVPAERALTLFLGSATEPAVPRTVAPGAVADLALLRVPPRDAIAAPDGDLVAATVVDGRVVHLATGH